MGVVARPRSRGFGSASAGLGRGYASSLLDEIREERTLIMAAVVAALSIYGTRSLWFPRVSVENMIPYQTCEMPLTLNGKGAIEGPWLNATWQKSSALLRGGMSAPRFQGLGKLVALAPGEDDGVLKPEHLTEGIEPFEETGNIVTLSFARMAERYLGPWLAIDGVLSRLGKRGMVKDVSLRAMATNTKLAPCVAHVRVTGGKVYFRYGSFLESARKLRRINLMIRSIQQAVTKYRLQALKAELYLNACDEPQSYDNSLSSGKSGFAVFSTQWTPGSTDILCPDPLDLVTVTEMPPAAAVRWNRRVSKAVWRGEGFEYELRRPNWASSLRVRLHRMSDARPDLLDARVTMWGPNDKGTAKEALVRSGFTLGTPIPQARAMNEFKYTVVVDEAVGTRDMCAALNGPQAVIRHASGFQQFFEPLLLPGVHFMLVRHSLADLPETIQWMKDNDAAVRQMVRNANDIAPVICSEDGQHHFWAVLLSKYTARAMENPDAVRTPRVCYGGKAITKVDWADEKTGPTCKHPSGDPCTDFCTLNRGEDEWTWLDSEAIPSLSKIMA